MPVKYSSMLDGYNIKILTTKAQQRAYELLGDKNFQGLDVAMTFFSPFSLKVLEGSQFRIPLRLRCPQSKQLLWEEDSVRLIERHRKTHAVVATQPIHLLDIIDRQPEAFSPEMSGDRSWLRTKKERHWVTKPISDPWILVPKDPDWAKDAMIPVADYVYGATLCFKATGLPPFGREQRFPLWQRKEAGTYVYVEWYAGGLLLL